MFPASPGPAAIVGVIYGHLPPKKSHLKTHTFDTDIIVHRYLRPVVVSPFGINPPYTVPTVPSRNKTAVHTHDQPFLLAQIIAAHTTCKTHRSTCTERPNSTTSSSCADTTAAAACDTNSSNAMGSTTPNNMMTCRREGMAVCS